MTEEEGKMMDDLLSEAFKNYKKNSSKNPKHIKEKINFRLRYKIILLFVKIILLVILIPCQFLGLWIWLTYIWKITRLYVS